MPLQDASYLFSSDRLGFRPWQNDDLPGMAAICADEQVMTYFPRTLTKEETWNFIERMQVLYEERQHCYFAVELLENRQLIGFIGLGYQTFESTFTPMVDLGWRLTPEVWGCGLATEGARRCMIYAKNELGLNHLYAIAPELNLKSIKVMKKIGLQFNQEFLHPLLGEYKELQRCVLYDKSI